MITYPKPNEYRAKIIEISENYVLAKLNKQKVIIYSNQDLTYDTKITYTGDYKEIFTPESKYSFQFDKYMLRNNIKYSIKAQNIKVSKPGKSLRAKLYNRIKPHPDKDLLNKILFKINSQDIEYSVLLLMASAGVIIKSIINLIRKILSKFLYADQVYVVELCLYLFFMLIFKHYLFYLNLLIYTILIKLKYNKTDASFLAATIILLINPLYMYSLTFIINFLFRLVACISLNKNFRFIESLLILIPIQLIIFFKTNILQILGYRYYKFIGVVAYLLAIVDIIFKSRLVNKFLKLTDFNISLLTITGHMSYVVLLLWVFFALLVLSRKKLIYKLFLVLLLIINQNQLLFNPSFVYTQLYVGQGDCAIMRYPFKNKVLFIDTGPPISANKLKSYLDYYGVRKIHTIIISHDDLDHSGNKDFLIKNYLVETIVEDPLITNFYKLEISSINFNMQDINENSLISYFMINDYTYLSLGDVSQSVELMFLKDYPYIRPNIIKIGHHGSDTSSSKELLQLDSISLLLNSSGYNNLYNHPNYRVLERILKQQLAFIDTQQVGDIEIIHLFGYNFLSY